MTAVPSARGRAATTVKGMSSSDDLARALGVDTEQVCRAILADARVLKAVRGGLTEHLGQQMLAAIPGVVQVVRSERGGAWVSCAIAACAGSRAGPQLQHAPSDAAPTHHPDVAALRQRLAAQAAAAAQVQQQLGLAVVRQGQQL